MSACACMYSGCAQAGRCLASSGGVDGLRASPIHDSERWKPTPHEMSVALDAEGQEPVREAARPEHPAAQSAPTPAGLTEREQFEAWIRTRGGAIMKRNGVYVDSMTRLWWECWQARAALSAPEQAALTEPLFLRQFVDAETGAIPDAKIDSLLRCWRNAEGLSEWSRHFHHSLRGLVRATASLAAQQAEAALTDAACWEQGKPDSIDRAMAYEAGTWFQAGSVDEMQAFYRARLPAIREAAREHGYAIGVHGSERRDFDLIACPWRDGASDPDTLAHAVAMAACGITREGAYDWTEKPLGRIAVSIPVCWTARRGVTNDGHIDLSVALAAMAASKKEG